MLLAALGASEASGLPRRFFSRGPLAGGPCIDLSCLFAGLVSRVALIAWVACATACVLLAHLERVRKGPSREAGLLLYGGVLTAVMSLDEAFQLHTVPNFFFPDGKVLFYLAYAAAAVIFLVNYGAVIRRSSAWLLALALLLLGFSIGLDQLTGREFVEDAAKLAGVGTWSVYLVGTGLALARSSPGAGGPDGFN